MEEREDAGPRPAMTFPSPPPAIARHHRTLTISTSTATVLLAGMIVLLFMAFAAGRHYESKHPSDYTQADFLLETEEEPASETSLTSATDTAASGRSGGARARPVGDEETTGAQRRTPDLTSAAPRQVNLQRGHHYVVVQHFNRSHQQADAIAAAEFLQANGVPCAILQGADIRLIATEPFLIAQTDAAAARSTREQANRLLDRVKQLGQQYNRELLNQGKKGYTFSECYLYLVK
jgi:hypothetical protein